MPRYVANYYPRGTNTDTLQAVLSYLGLICRTFTHIVGQNLELVDSVTVKMLKSRAPKVSSNDLDFLQREMDDGNLFPFIENIHDREQIWERLKDVEFPIPTLETFFQDILFLDVARCNMKQICLSLPEGDGTVDKTLKSQYSNPAGQNIDIKIWDLWRFSFQYAFEMSTVNDHRRRVLRKREDIDRAATFHLVEAPNDDLTSDLKLYFTWLAWNHGFRTPGLESNEPQCVEIPSPLRCDFPPEDNEDMEVERRCGRPFEDTAQTDRYALTLESLMFDSTASRVSARFVRQSVFRAFFSYLNPQFEENVVPSQPSSEVIPDDSGGTEPLVDEGMPYYSSIPGPENIEYPAFPDLHQNYHEPLEFSSAHVEQGTYFGLETQVGQTTQMHQVPHNRIALNNLFEALDAAHFHIYNGGRTLHWPDCYVIYFFDPTTWLSAIYCKNGCPQHRPKTDTETESASRLLEEAVEETKSAQNDPFYYRQL